MFAYTCHADIPWVLEEYLKVVAHTDDIELLELEHINDFLNSELEAFD